MVNITKKSGQIIKKLNRFSRKTSEKSKEHIKTHFIARVGSAVESRLLILEWLLLVSAITLFAIIQAIWYSNAYTNTVFVYGGSYSEATLGEISSLNPLFASNASERTASRLLFATLVGIDTTGQLENQLAERVTHDDSGKVWTVILRENIHWSDGQPITADDIVYTFSVINDPSAKTVYSDSFSTVKIEKLDARTVTFTLPTVFADFVSTLTIPLLPAHILGEVPAALLPEHAFSLQPIGSGPFVFDALQQSASAQNILLAKNPKYFRGEPILNRFSIYTYATEEEISDALERHDVTATASLSTFPDQPDIYQKNATLSRGTFAFLNTANPILSKPEARRALRYALDISDMRDDLGVDSPLDYPILTSQAELTFPALPEFSGEKAMELLLAAGFVQKNDKKLYTSEEDDTPAELSIATISTGRLAAFAERIAADLSTIGFSVSLNILEPSESQAFFTSIVQPRAYDILLYEIDMGLYADLLPYYHSTQATATGLNLSNYKNAITDDLALSARSTFDVDLRRVKYESFLRHWVDDVPAIGLYQSELTYFYSRQTRPFSENSALVSPLDRFSDVLYWASEKDTRFRTP